jgi:hypothetical protein
MSEERTEYTLTEYGAGSQGQEKKRDRARQAVYLDVDVRSWIKHRIADTGEEMSDVVNERCAC